MGFYARREIHLRYRRDSENRALTSTRHTFRVRGRRTRLYGVYVILKLPSLRIPNTKYRAPEELPALKIGGRNVQGVYGIPEVETLEIPYAHNFRRAGFSHRQVS